MVYLFFDKTYSRYILSGKDAEYTLISPYYDVKNLILKKKFNPFVITNIEYFVKDI